MKFLENIFRSPSKHHANNALKKMDSQLILSQKLVGYSKSETLSQYNCPEISMDTDFFLSKLIDVKLGTTDIVPKSMQQKSHMVYEICVLASDFQYKIKKRFSLFNEFYCSIKKQIGHLNITFPKKTILVSGTNIDVVTERYELLNKFVKQIFIEAKQNQNNFVLLKFLTFLQIDQEYEKRKIKSYTQLPKDPDYKNDSVFCVGQTSIISELRRLNDYNNHQKDVLLHIETYINYKNHKITNDEIRILLIGNHSMNLKGLLNLSLSINNQIKALQLLRFLIGYICPQKKSYHDKIYKQFQKLPLEAFHFNYEKIKNNFNVIEFKRVFFIILELYCQSKIFTQQKILETHPELLKQFELWKNLYELNQGNLTKKASSYTNLHIDHNLKKTFIQEKAKSFEINPKICETQASSGFPLKNTDNAGNLAIKSFATDEKQVKCSFRSNDSTSELTIQQDWQNCKLKLQLGQLEDHLNNGKFQILKASDSYILKTNKTNKLMIELWNIEKSVQQCEKLSEKWNKLIYDQRHDPFTQISRIYMKLNGKCKIFKFKQQDETVEKKDENFVRIVKKRIESHNSIAKSGKQNLDECFRIKVSQVFNGFQQIITIQSINENSKDYRKQQFEETEQKQSLTKVTIELNFEGQQDYFRTEIAGITTELLNSAVETFLN